LNLRDVDYVNNVAHNTIKDIGWGSEIKVTRSCTEIHK